MFCIRLTSQVSTVDAFDVGAENVHALPSERWVQVTYVFTNFTAPAARRATSSAPSPADAAGGEPASQDGDCDDDHCERGDESESGATLGGEAASSSSSSSSEGGSAGGGHRLHQHDGPHYRIDLYLDGVFDAALTFQRPVLANRGPM